MLWSEETMEARKYLATCDKSILDLMWKRMLSQETFFDDNTHLTSILLAFIPNDYTKSTTQHEDHVPYNFLMALKEPTMEHSVPLFCPYSVTSTLYSQQRIPHTRHQVAVTLMAWVYRVRFLEDSPMKAKDLRKLMEATGDDDFVYMHVPYA
jgi:hypothetical protein